MKSSGYINKVFGEKYILTGYSFANIRKKGTEDGKEILLAVDNSRHSRNAIHYAVHVFSFVKNLHYILFNIQPAISLFLKDEAEKSLTVKSQLENIVKKNKEAALELLENYKAEMVQMGTVSDRIETVTRTRKLGLGKDIIDFGQNRNFDAIVIGRRGFSRLQEMYLGSVSRYIINRISNRSLWIVT